MGDELTPILGHAVLGARAAILPAALATKSIYGREIHLCGKFVGQNRLLTKFGLILKDILVSCGY